MTRDRRFRTSSGLCSIDPTEDMLLFLLHRAVLRAGRKSRLAMVEEAEELIVNYCLRSVSYVTLSIDFDCELVRKTAIPSFLWRVIISWGHSSGEKTLTHLVSTINESIEKPTQFTTRCTTRRDLRKRRHTTDTRWLSCDGRVSLDGEKTLHHLPSTINESIILRARREVHISERPAKAATHHRHALVQNSFSATHPVYRYRSAVRHVVPNFEIAKRLKTQSENLQAGSHSCFIILSYTP
jgi:hypothetical protein